MNDNILKVADLFCGAGGTTTGAMQAIHAMGREVEFVAVNHWPIAIATHEINHPNVRHYCKDLDTANPSEIVPEGYGRTVGYPFALKVF